MTYFCNLSESCEDVTYEYRNIKQVVGVGSYQLQVGGSSVG